MCFKNAKAFIGANVEEGFFCGTIKQPVREKSLDFIENKSFHGNFYKCWNNFY